MVAGDTADGEDPDEEAGDVVGESGFTKKAPGTIEKIAPILSGGVLFQLAVSLRCQLC